MHKDTLIRGKIEGAALLQESFRKWEPVCPTGCDCTFEGAPIYGVACRSTTKIASELHRDCLGIASGTVRFTLAEISISFSDFTEPFPRKPRSIFEPIYRPFYPTKAFVTLILDVYINIFFAKKLAYIKKKQYLCRLN